MKIVVNHPEERKTGKRYWRSLSEFDRSPSFQTKLEREFMDGQAEMKTDDERESSRRTFLKLMGASTALAGMAACRRPEAYIKPYAKSPEWVIPGRPLYYATSMPRNGGAQPLVVTTFEGRPTHLMGNKLHPDSNGSVDIYAQGAILGLYDPDRSKNFYQAGKKSTKEAFIKALDEKKAALSKDSGKGLAILVDEVNSPTRNRLIADLKKKFSAAKVYKYEALTPVGKRAATQQAFGAGVVPVYHLDKADKILSLDSDFMGLDSIGNGATLQFMNGRKAEKETDPMNRLYVVEGRYSMTGGIADHRLRVAPSQIFKVAAKLAAQLGVAINSPAKDADVGHPNAAVWLEEAAKDLLASKGKAVVIAGDAQPAEVHLLVAAINNALGAFGGIIELKQGEKSDAGTLADLAKSLESKETTTVFAITEADPAFDAPVDLKIGEKLKSADFWLLSTRHRTATARLAAWEIPATHFLEQWGDVRTLDGTYGIVQPMILPLFGGLSDIELLSLLLDDTPATSTTLLTPHSLAPAPVGVPEDPGVAFKAVRATFDALTTAANKNDAWNYALRDGFLPKSAYPAVTPSFNTGTLAAADKYAVQAVPTFEEMELDLIPCSKIYDGRYINNGWLQEAPDPISKVTWDNCALVSVKTAKQLKVARQYLTIDEQAAVISITANGTTVELPLVVIPGHVDNVITVNLGYGQGTGENGPGLVGDGTGINVYGFRTSANPYFSPAKVALVEKTLKLALTQEHSSMYGRDLVREGTNDDWKEKPDFVLEMGSDAHVTGTREEKKKENEYTFYKPVGGKDEKGDAIPHLHDKLHQWGMVIDLNRCLGCSTCLVACQSENNIPIVGKEQVIRGREMHWIRMDRYFATDLDEEVNPESKFFGTGKDVWEEDFLDEPEMVVQPVACQQCESAPCETVCPVNATVHTPDGLNAMVYNRCIGTRYCANNCPFKARRFNFFDYNKRNPLVKSKVFDGGNLYDGPFGDRWDTELSKLNKNPNVSVRMRGVMEKCTYCVQRIEMTRAEARARGRKKAALETGIYDENLTVTDDQIRIPTNGVKVACQESCPAEAISFGNIVEGSNDDVNKWRKNSRNYEILSYLAIKARTTYLARIKNPNKALTERVEFEKKKAGNASKYHVGHHAHEKGHATPKVGEHHAP